MTVRAISRNIAPVSSLMSLATLIPGILRSATPIKSEAKNMVSGLYTVIFQLLLSNIVLRLSIKLYVFWPQTQQLNQQSVFVKNITDQFVLTIFCTGFLSRRHKRWRYSWIKVYQGWADLVMLVIAAFACQENNESLNTIKKFQFCVEKVACMAAYIWRKQYKIHHRTLVSFFPTETLT